MSCAILAVSVVLNCQDLQPEVDVRRQQLATVLGDEVLSVMSLDSLLLIEEMKAFLKLDAKTVRKLELLVKRAVQRQKDQVRAEINKTVGKIGFPGGVPAAVRINARVVRLTDEPDKAPTIVLVEFAIVPRSNVIWLEYSVPNGGRRTSRVDLRPLTPAKDPAWGATLKDIPAEDLARFRRHLVSRKKEAVVTALQRALSCKLHLRPEQEGPVRAWLTPRVHCSHDGVVANVLNRLPGLPERGPDVLTGTQQRAWRLLRLNGFTAAQW